MIGDTDSTIPAELLAAMRDGASGAEIRDGHTRINGRPVFVLAITIWGTMEECERYRNLLERAMQEERGAEVVYDKTEVRKV